MGPRRDPFAACIDPVRTMQLDGGTIMRDYVP